MNQTTLIIQSTYSLLTGEFVMREKGIFAMVAAIIMIASVTNAGVRDNSCDCTSKTCKVEIEYVPVIKECYKTECKEICIPAVRFPWESCCTPKCGKVITIKTLKKETYQCGTKQVCKWSVVPTSCSTSSCAFDGAPAKKPYEAKPAKPPIYKAKPAPAPAPLSPSVKPAPTAAFLRIPGQSIGR
jgi:hypothetical protein